MYFNHDGGLDYKTQYKRLILQHHPDKGGDAATFRAIQAEYKTILFFRQEDASKGCRWADLMEEEDIELQIRSLTDDVLAVRNEKA